VTDRQEKEKRRAEQKCCRHTGTCLVTKAARRKGGLKNIREAAVLSDCRLLQDESRLGLSQAQYSEAWAAVTLL
jgi:hypothetical protein